MRFQGGPRMTGWDVLLPWSAQRLNVDGRIVWLINPHEQYSTLKWWWHWCCICDPGSGVVAVVRQVRGQGRVWPGGQGGAAGEFPFFDAQAPLSLTAQRVVALLAAGYMYRLWDWIPPGIHRLPPPI